MVRWPEHVLCALEGLSPVGENPRFTSILTQPYHESISQGVKFGGCAIFGSSRDRQCVSINVMLLP